MTIPPLILGMEAVVYWKGSLSEPALSVPFLIGKQTGRAQWLRFLFPCF